MKDQNVSICFIFTKTMHTCHFKMLCNCFSITVSNAPILTVKWALAQCEAMNTLSSFMGFGLVVRQTNYGPVVRQTNFGPVVR